MDKIKMNKNTFLTLLKQAGIWILGCLLYATAVNGFAIPNSIAQSGMTGVSVILHKLFEWPIGLVGFILNIPLLLLMYFLIGRGSLIKTLVVSAILSVSLDLMSYLFGSYIPVYKGDPILAALICGALEGAGLGMIMTTDATSGGTDIIGRLFHKYFPHISVGRVVMVADWTIVIAYMCVFRSFESGLYAIIVAFVSTKVIDSLLYGMGSGKMLMIFTSKADEIANGIISSSRRGVSIIPATGAYTRENKNLLIIVARKSEVSGLLKTVKSIDSGTFIIISEANEILGNGFNSTL